MRRRSIRSSIARRGGAPPDRRRGRWSTRRPALRRRQRSWVSTATRATVRLGVGDEDVRRLCGARCRRGGDARPRRAGRAARARPSGTCSHTRRAWRGTRAAPISRPGERRIYSNSGFVVLAAHLEARAEMAFARYLNEAVLTPLSLGATFDGDAAAGLTGTLGDVLALRAGAARADARRAGDARRGDVRPVPGSRRRAARLRASDPERLGARARAPRCEVAALDGIAELAGDLWPFRLASPARRPSSGSIQSESSRAPRSRTSRSATGRERHGPGSRTPCSAKEVEQQPVELGGALDAGEVPRALDRLQPRSRDRCGDLLAHRPDVGEVLGADDDERGHAELV